MVYDPSGFFYLTLKSMEVTVRPTKEKRSVWANTGIPHYIFVPKPKPGEKRKRRKKREPVPAFKSNKSYSNKSIRKLGPSLYCVIFDKEVVFTGPRKECTKYMVENS